MHGFPADIAVTKAIYESLLVQMVADCERHLRSGNRDEQTVWDSSRRRYVARPVATITARLAFYEAYAWRIGERLDEAREAALAAAGAVADPAAPERSTETALALRQKELDVHDFFAEALRRNNIRGTWAADRRPEATTGRWQPRKASAPRTGPASATRRRWAKQAERSQRDRPSGTGRARCRQGRWSS